MMRAKLGSAQSGPCVMADWVPRRLVCVDCARAMMPGHDVCFSDECVRARAEIGPLCMGCGLPHHARACAECTRELVRRQDIVSSLYEQCREARDAATFLGLDSGACARLLAVMQSMAASASASVRDDYWRLFGDGW